MTQTDLPASAIPLAATAPMSSEEAAALASRMRVQARLPRIAVVGSVLGLLCGIVTLWPFVISSTYVVSAMVIGGAEGWASVLFPLLACGLLLLLAFYSLRLQFQSGSTTAGAIEDNLRKIRFVLAVCMTLSVAASYIALASPMVSGVATAGLYALSTITCGVVVNDVRKGRGEFETAGERRRRRMARGFAVELNAAIPLAGFVAPPSPPPLPGASTAPVAGDAGHVSAGAVPPPLPVVPSTPSLSFARLAPPGRPAAFSSEIDHDRQAERDLRMLVHVVAAIGIAIYVLRSTEVFSSIEAMLNTFQGARTRRSVGIVGAPPTLTTSLAPLRSALDVLVGMAGVAWIAWGILVLNFGAKLRFAAYTVAWVTLASVVLVTGLNVAGLIEAAPTRFGRGQQTGVTIALTWRFPEFLHALLLLVLLSRPSVKGLFYRGSEAGEDV